MNGTKTAFEILSESDVEQIAEYIEIDVVIDGANADSYVFAVPQDDALLEAVLSRLEREAGEHSTPVEVYELWHMHGPVEHECMCSQYVQDHKPSWTFNA